MGTKRILIPVMAVVLLLTAGCSSMLERSYYSEEKHYEQYLEVDESSAVEVGDYRELKSAILYFVEQGMNNGTVRAREYDGDITADLTEICLSLQNDPMGAYAVEYISHEKVNMVTYSEVNVYFTYRVSKEQMQTLRDVSYYNLSEEFEKFFASGESYAAFNISYLSMTTEELQQLFAQAQDFAPAPAISELMLYPDSGLQRIVEITADYGMEKDDIQRRCMELEESIKGVLKDVPAAGDEEKCLWLAGALADKCAYDKNAGSEGYDALVNGAADSRGYARAYMLLCRELDIDCEVVCGTKFGDEWYFNSVTLGEDTFYLDPATDDVQYGGETWLRTAEEAAQIYTW